MKDVTPKPETLREAVAQALLKVPRDVVSLVEEGKTEKGDALEVARTAGIMAAKKTSELIPFCHSIPLSHIEITFRIEEEGILIESRVRAIGQTGVEMEALTAVSLSALTLYDMLKPYTHEMEVVSIGLLSKRGGKSDYRVTLEPAVEAALIVLSDSVAQGRKEDRAGKAVLEILEREGLRCKIYEVLPDDPKRLRERTLSVIREGVDLLMTVGGTGLSPRDQTVDTIKPMLEKEIPGIMEAARSYGQRRTPYAMLSRGIAGMIGQTLVVTLPGSLRGARESCEALFPAILHIFEVLRKIPHEEGNQ